MKTFINLYINSLLFCILILTILCAINENSVPEPNLLNVFFSTGFQMNDFPNGHFKVSPGLNLQTHSYQPPQVTFYQLLKRACSNMVEDLTIDFLQRGILWCCMIRNCEETLADPPKTTISCRIYFLLFSFLWLEFVLFNLIFVIWYLIYIQSFYLHLKKAKLGKDLRRRSWFWESTYWVKNVHLDLWAKHRV